MILTIILASIIQTNLHTNLGVQNGADNNIHNILFASERRSVIIPGDSYRTIEQKEAEAKANASRLASNAGIPGNSSHTESGSEVQIVGESYQQCVVYFKEQTGYAGPLGYAGNIRPNSETPEVGEGALEQGHISLIIAVGADSVRVREANWIRGKITERTVPKSKIRGYFKT